MTAIKRYVIVRSSLRINTPSITEGFSLTLNEVPSLFSFKLAQFLHSISLIHAEGPVVISLSTLSGQRHQDEPLEVQDRKLFVDQFDLMYSVIVNLCYVE